MENRRNPPQNGASQSTGLCGESFACPQPCGSTGLPKFIHRKIFDFPRGNVEKIWVLKNARFGAYREELMLEVMSRTADCSGEAGSFRLISTLRME